MWKIVSGFNTCIRPAFRADVLAMAANNQAALAIFLSADASRSCRMECCQATLEVGVREGPPIRSPRQSRSKGIGNDQVAGLIWLSIRGSYATDDSDRGRRRWL